MILAEVGACGVGACGAVMADAADAIPHPNVVWLGFLEKWAGEAHEKGTKSASAYDKAHRSLASHRQAFAHPSETLQLSGIGSLIAGKIENEYAKWCKEHGEVFPERRTWSSPIRTHRSGRRR